MLNPGPIQLTYGGVGAFPIVGPGTFIGDWITGLSGMLAASLQAQFLYGGGGASVTIFFQTSFDQGQTPVDIAAFSFGTGSGTDVVNLSALTTRAVPLTPTQQALAAGSVNDGLLGDRLRAVVVVSGIYGGSTLLNATACVR
jgi:hypothetical protein